MGRACGYCHMPHAGPPATLDRTGRTMLRKMSTDRMLDLFLPILYERAEEAGLMMEAAPLLALLAQAEAVLAEAQSQAARRPCATKGSGSDPLEATRSRLRKMTFGELVGLLCRNCEKEAFVPEVTEELLSLRDQCADRVQL
ncbi:unnamed protein product [Symbiodinium natans]|uniref:Uncharacterized protein n=1 Tax=Symbiodinium natans TaxID=878477 RepID=A0A812NA76_9DINO|nr:unnamed protein product [Symbiodinium natans]